MRAVVLTGLDGPKSVEVREVAAPQAHGAVLVDVHAAGISFPELLMSRGLYQDKPELPFVMGSEFAGTVREAPVGSGLTVGDRVAGLSVTGGGLAEIAVARPNAMVKLPEEISLDAAGGLLFNDLTVHFALEQRGRLAPGETVLVHGAAGGIGTSAVRMARALGAGRVIAVVGTVTKQRAALDAGADEAVLAGDWLAEVHDRTGGSGVDIVLDPVGGDRFTDSLRALRTGGRCLVIGFTAGSIPAVKVNRLLLHNIDVVGVGWGAYVATHPDNPAAQWSRLEPLYREGRIVEPMVSMFPLEQAADAVARMEARELIGKAVIVMER